MFETQIRELETCKGISTLKVFLHITENDDGNLDFAAIIGSICKTEYIYMEENNITENNDDFFKAFKRLMSSLRANFGKNNLFLYTNLNAYCKMLELMGTRYEQLKKESVFRLNPEFINVKDVEFIVKQILREDNSLLSYKQVFSSFVKDIKNMEKNAPEEEQGVINENEIKALAFVKLAMADPLSIIFAKI